MAVELFEPGSCPTPDDFNDNFSDLEGRIIDLEAAAAADLSPYMKRDGTTAATAPIPGVAATLPAHFVILSQVDAITKGTTTVTSTALISAPAGSTAVVSARSAVRRAYISAQSPTQVTITIVDLAGAPDATPTQVDWIIK